MDKFKSSKAETEDFDNSFNLYTLRKNRKKNIAIVINNTFKYLIYINFCFYK